LVPTSPPSAATIAMPSSAVKHPEHWAWQQFIMINWPASALGRGVPDTDKKFGDPGKAVWETWKEPVEVYLADGARPPGWDIPANSISGSPALHLLLAHEKGLHRGSKVGHKSLLVNVLNQSSADQAREFLEGFEIRDHWGEPLWYEVRMNRPAFDYVLERELYNVEGQIAAVQRDPIKFPMESMEVKASWMVVNPALDASRYHTAKALIVEAGQAPREVTVALTGLHLTSRALPQWTWATFEHVDNAVATRAGERVLRECPDVKKANAEMQKALVGSKWANYELVGIQTQFTDATGRPTRLANSQIETSMQSTSSCISCHARASISASGKRLPPQRVSRDVLIGPLGTPDPREFFGLNGQPTYYPLDFVWSLSEAHSINPTAK
jgi:hypothetical protein